jgi:hypothetical protein
VSRASREPGWPADPDSAFDDCAAGAPLGVRSDPCLTFDQARSLAVRHMEAHHPLAHHAHYAAAAHGWQNATHWHVRVDEARYIHTGDQQYMLVGTPEVLVDKTTGEVTTLALLSAPTLFADMTTADEHLHQPRRRAGGDRIGREEHIPRPVPVWLVQTPPHPA